MSRLMRQIIPVAIERAEQNGLTLSVVDADDAHFRLTRHEGERLIWSVELWPTIDDFARVAWREGYKGPVLLLPRPWTILDAVEAMIQAKAAEGTDEKPGRPFVRRRR